MLEISFVILSIAFLLLAGALAAVFYQLCKILQRLHPTIDQMNLRVPGILRNLEDVAENVKDVSSQVHFQVTNLTRLLSRVQAGLEVISVMEGKVRSILLLPFWGRPGTWARCGRVCPSSPGPLFPAVARRISPENFGFI